MSGLYYGLFIALQTGGVALCVSLAVTGFARIAGLGDVPNHRSSHSRLTPTSGGLGVIAGVGAGLLCAALFHSDIMMSSPWGGPRLASITALIFGVAMLGLIDDRFVLPPKPKFAILLLLSGLLAVSGGVVTRLPLVDSYQSLPWIIGLGGTTLWLFVTINTVNFMDGIDGLMGLSMAVASGALCLLAIRVGAPQAALLSGTLCAALIGFLVYNAPPRARIFAGDCGALMVGATYAVAVLVMVREQPDLRLLYAGPLLILPLLTDVLMTLLSKPFRGIPMMEAHRSHLFQRLTKLTESHSVVTLLYGMMCAGLAQLVLFAFVRGTLGSIYGVTLMTVAFIGLYTVVSRLLPKDV